MDRVKELERLIAEWDSLAKKNTKDNIYNLSTSQRQDWVDELEELTENDDDEVVLTKDGVAHRNRF